MHWRATAGKGRRVAPSGRALFRLAHRRQILLLLGCLALASPGFGADFTVFGPQTFTRAGGQPVTVTSTFQVANPSDPFTLVVTNRGVTNGVISINGQKVLTEADFTGTSTGVIRRSISVRAGSNQIAVQLIAPTGTSLVAQIVGIDNVLPIITATPSPAPNGSGWNNGTVTVAFTCSDADSGIATCPASVVVNAEGANQVVSGTAVDKAGNRATASVTLNIDKTPPVVTATRLPAANANGWNSTPVVVTFAAADTLSGVAAGSLSSPVTLSVDGLNESASGQAKDVAGNLGSVTLSGINIDQTKPTITVALSPMPSANGIYTSPVTAHFTCADALSGVASCSPDLVVATAGANQTVTGTAIDRAGNTASATSAPFTIQIGTPTITVTLSPPPNGNGWNNTPVTAHFTCTENGAPLAGCPPDRMSSTQGANQTVTGSVTDAAGQTASVTSDPFSIDLSAPGITPVLSPSPNANGWNNTAVTAHFDCTDTLSGIATCTPDQMIGTDGSNQSVSGTAVDRAGNTASATGAPFNIDRTPPTISITLTGPTNNGVYTGPVTGHFTCTDTLSGIATCPSDQTISTIGPNQTISGTATDRAGNSASKTSDPFTIAGLFVSDFNPKTAPAGSVINLTGSGFTPSSAGAPTVTLSRQGGGTIDAPVSGATNSTLAFVIPAGAASGTVIVTVNGQSASSADSLTVTSSSSFTLAAAPGSANLIQGQSVAFAVTISGDNGFVQPVSLNVTGLPTGVSATFDRPEITAGQTAVLTVTGPTDQTATSSTLTILGSATASGIPITQSATVTVTGEVATTSLLGRTVVSDTFETPISAVTVTMLGKNGNGGTTACSGQTVSDAAGNFALTSLGPECVGPQLVGYNGLTATSPPGKYAGVNLLYTLQANQVTTSPVLVHLPRIDDKETFYVRQNYTQNQSYVYQSIPGLSVTVYAGTTFTLEDGSTPDPFPLVAVQVPVDRLPDQKPPVPTMLSAFIVAFQPANAVASQPAAVFYPNTLNTEPGVNMTLMTLDPTRGRMIPYGTATVSPGGTQITPDADPAHAGHRYGIVNFDWHGPMAPPPIPPPIPNPPNAINPNPGGGGCGGSADACDHGGDCECPVTAGANPVDLSSGLETIIHTDITIGGLRGAVSIRRFFRTLSTFAGSFGIGTNHNFGYSLDTVNFQSAALINLITPDGNRFPFTKELPLAEPGSPPPNTNMLRNYTNPAMVGAVMTALPTEVQLRWKDGTVYHFVPPSPQFTPQLGSIVDANGNTVTITHGANPNQITQITDAGGRSLRLTYDGASRIISIIDQIGRSVNYTYNGQGTLETVTDPEGGVTKYEYDSSNRPTKETDARGVVVAQTTYDDNGRVATQTQADGGLFQFTYFTLNDTAPTSPILNTVVTDPLGTRRHYHFTPAGFLVDTNVIGSGPVVVMVRDALTSQIVARQPLGNSTGQDAYQYDSLGNVLKHIDALGSATTYTYEPTFNRVATITDALGETTAFSYDGRGNLVSRTDANGHATSYVYDTNGLLTHVTDPLGRTTQFQYDTSGNLFKITDAVGAVTQFQYDGISRLVQTLDSLGRQTLMQYDGLNRVVAQTDAKGQTTAFSYDRAGNLLSVKDARNKTTTFAYDALNRLTTRTDPVGKSDLRGYDPVGNLVSFTDRRGQGGTFSYDLLRRLVREQYTDGSRVDRTYDDFGRLTSVAEAGTSASTFSFNYDLTGALLLSVGPFGSVQYQRDALRRVLSRQVSGQPAQAHTYDAAGNLLSASMPGASVNITYDPANQVTALSRSNGVSSSYSSDPVGRVLSIVHARGTTILQSLSYSYDPSGARISEGTSAQSLATQPTTASYDDANRLILSGATSYAYDANGNLLSEKGPSGTTIYTWDSRNRLSTVTASSGQTTHFQYEFAGNLIHQADSGPLTNASRSFVLDSLTNVAYEQSTDGTQLSVLSGRSIDSHLATVGSGGQIEFGLSDAINSTVATTDQGGTIKGQLSYEPFGNTAASGTQYPFQYTGRVPISSSVYYYRARFYSPTSARFISEDPLGFFGGVNFFSYVRNSPLQFSDPSGLLFGPPSTTSLTPPYWQLYQPVSLPPPPNWTGSPWTAPRFFPYVPSPNQDWMSPPSRYDNIREAPFWEDPLFYVHCLFL